MQVEKGPILRVEVKSCLIPSPQATETNLRCFQMITALSKPEDDRLT